MKRSQQRIVACGCLLVAALAGVLLAGCAALPQDRARFVDTWELISFESEGDAMSAEDIQLMKDLGVVVFLHINDDGSIVLDQHGTELVGTWQAISARRAQVSFDDSVATLTLNNDTLTFVDSGSTMVFTRSVDETEDADSSADSTDADDESASTTDESTADNSQ